MRKQILLWASCLFFVVACNDDEDCDSCNNDCPVCEECPDSQGEGQSSEEESIPASPVRGAECVTVLDQYDWPVTCHFGFEVNEEVLAENERYLKAYGEEGWMAEPPECHEGSLLVYGEPGEYIIPATCGELDGYVMVELRRNETETSTTRLIGSLCHDDTTFIVDPEHPIVELQGHLGFSDDVRCSEWFSGLDITHSLIVDLILDCEDEDCDPVDGRDYLEVRGDPGERSIDGTPLHLSLAGRFNEMSEGQEVTVLVTVRYLDPANQTSQELGVPVVVRNSS